MLPTDAARFQDNHPIGRPRVAGTFCSTMITVRPGRALMSVTTAITLRTMIGGKAGGRLVEQEDARPVISAHAERQHYCCPPLSEPAIWLRRSCSTGNSL